MTGMNLRKIAFTAVVVPFLLVQFTMSPATAKSAKPSRERQFSQGRGKCTKPGVRIENGKACAALIRAEPAVAKTNGFFPFPASALFAQAAAATLAVTSNSKNCGKGNNSNTGNGNGGQNNGNCPASP